MKNNLRRRDFLKTVGLGGAAFLSAEVATSALLAADPAPAPSMPQVVRGSDRPVAAVIGVGGRGGGIAEWQMPPFADVVAICDVDLRKTDAVAQAIYKRTGRKVEIYQDYRKLLDRKDIQVIANATCPHWHAKITIDACRAGKDVYTEKPLTNTVDEGKTLRKVIAETGRIVQVGSQQRSGLQFQIGCSLVRNGRIGKLQQVAVVLPISAGRGFAHGGAAVEEPVPEGLNWELWTGPAPLRPFSPARLRSNGWSDYGGGLVTDWGAHYMDTAHCGMGGEEVGPLSVEAEGYCPNLGKPNYPDQFHPFAARLEYPDGVELWFFSAYTEPGDGDDPALRKVNERVYGKVPEKILKDTHPGVLFVGSKGTIFVSREDSFGEGIGELQTLPLVENEHMRWRSCLYPHMENFIDCVRTRHKPRSYVAEQHRSLIPCHLTNISLRLGRKLQWDPKLEQFVGDTEANAALRQVQRAPYRIEA